MYYPSKLITALFVAAAALPTALAMPYSSYQDEGSAPNDSVPACPPHYASSKTQEALFHAYVQKFYVQENVTGAVEDYVADDYIQHNPYVDSGKENAIKALSVLFTGVNITLLHTGFENGYGWVFSRFDIPGLPPTATMDLLRYNGSCIQEHWESSEALPANATNPLALF